MVCLKQIDDMLKKDFSISSKNILYSHRLLMEQRKNDLLLNIRHVFEDLISESEYNQIRHLVSNPLHSNSKFVFENNYFDLVINLKMEQKNIISMKYIVHVEFNQYVYDFPYIKFCSMSYEEFKQKLLSSDKYDFCFLKTKFENIVCIQQCFC